MLQNGQTEPVGITRRRILIRREVKFVHSKKIIDTRKISHQMKFLM